MNTTEIQTFNNDGVHRNLQNWKVVAFQHGCNFPERSFWLMNFDDSTFKKVGWSEENEHGVFIYVILPDGELDMVQFETYYDEAEA